MADASKLLEILELQREPVAIKFQATPPEALDRIEAAGPSGCSYWKLAAEGKAFYTVAADHYGCPIGSHTHGIELPEETAKELEGLVGTMVQLDYIRMDEVPQIPQMVGDFGVAVYAPLSMAVIEPDVVVVSGNVKQMMLLGEAAHAAGLAADSSTAGRPTCAAIPAVIASGGAASNLGCIGNRVYTEMSDDQLYFVIAGPQLERVVDKLSVIVNANTELQKFHQGRIA